MARRAVMTLALAAACATAPAVAVAAPAPTDPAPSAPAPSAPSDPAPSEPVPSALAPAAPAPFDGSASVGTATAQFGESAVDLGPLAPCTTDGPAAASTPGASSEDGSVVFGAGETKCALNPDSGLWKVAAKGRGFRLTALKAHGGPEIRVSSFTAGCTITAAGRAQASVSVGGVSGLSGVSFLGVLPINYTVDIPGAEAGEPVLARVTMNSVVTPSAVKGAVTVSALKVRLFPDGGPDSGTITVGQATCTPGDADS
ncbi:hypothetical protein [Actinokineospora pegani]|uniref:hypothetical protein n=1 Tax=Actinokineospora pegani TaxID=2654637 RepID=UPI0018D4AE0B|nr:hypothetical protein [Actinokineospora pegani]